MAGFFQEGGGATSQQKKRKGCFWEGHSPLGGKAEGFIMQITSPSFGAVGEMERAHVSHYLIGAAGKFLIDW